MLGDRLAGLEEVAEDYRMISKGSGVSLFFLDHLTILVSTACKALHWSESCSRQNDCDDELTEGENVLCIDQRIL